MSERLSTEQLLIYIKMFEPEILFWIDEARGRMALADMPPALWGRCVADLLTRGIAPVRTPLAGIRDGQAQDAGRD